VELNSGSENGVGTGETRRANANVNSALVKKVIQASWFKVH